MLAPSPVVAGVPAGRASLLWHEVGEIYAAVEADHPEQAMMAALGRVVPCYSAVLNAVSLQPNRLISWSSLRAESRDASGEPMIGAYLHRHPTLERLVRDASHGSVRLSDAATGTALRRNPFVEGYYRPNGLRAQITFSIGAAETVQCGAVWVVGLNRVDQLEFTAEDLACGDALRPHLERALRLLQARRRREAALAVRDGAAEAADCGTAAITADGRIVAATPVARRLLGRWFGADEAAERVPAALLSRLVGADTDGRADGARQWGHEREDGARLTVHCRGGGGAAPYGLWLRESRPAGEARIGAALGLTPRQALIARWIAEGKTNPEIALLLGISPRTVEKHVEQMLARLGVENRVAILRAVRDLAA